MTSSSSPSKRKPKPRTRRSLSVLNGSRNSGTKPHSNPSKRGGKAHNTLLLRFDDGAVQFRQRLAVSILSNRPILLRNIRSDDLNAPGLRAAEASFLRLLDRMTNGSRIEINSTGTQLRFVPGILIGGSIEHACPVSPGKAGDVSGNSGDIGDADGSPHPRSIGWFLEGVLPLAPFGKEALSLTMTGITDGTCDTDPSPDYLRSSALPLMQRFGIGVSDSGAAGGADFMSPAAPDLRLVRRGAAPAGGGRVEFYCPAVVGGLPPGLDWTDPGKIKRVRGTAVSCRVVSSSHAARVAFAAKGLLHRLLPDVWIHTDAHSAKRHGCGPSPSLSIVLTAKSTTGTVLSAEATLAAAGASSRRELPEDLGTRGAALLLEEVRRGGCVDTGMQSLALLWMCLTPEDVSRIRVGTLSEYTVQSLRLFKRALGVEFKVRADGETKTVLLSCLGTGYRNMARAST